MISSGDDGLRCSRPRVLIFFLELVVHMIGRTAREEIAFSVLPVCGLALVLSVLSARLSLCSCPPFIGQAKAVEGNHTYVIIAALMLITCHGVQLLLCNFLVLVFPC